MAAGVSSGPRSTVGWHGTTALLLGGYSVTAGCQVTLGFSIDSVSLCVVKTGVRVMDGLILLRGILHFLLYTSYAQGGCLPCRTVLRVATMIWSHFLHDGLR